MKSRAPWSIVFMLVIIIGVLLWLLFAVNSNPKTPIRTSIDTHIPRKPSPVITSPTPDTTPLSARVVVVSPRPQSTVAHTFTVSGKAPGGWFFEAVFPIQVRDENNNVLAHAQAHASGDWMTSNLVSFTSTVSIQGTYTGPATLILLRDNPSGLPENDDAQSVPIVIR